MCNFALKILEAYHGSRIQMVPFVLFVKRTIESVTQFFLDCSYFKNNFDSLLNKLKLKISGSSPTDETHISAISS